VCVWCASDRKKESMCVRVSACECALIVRVICMSVSKGVSV